MDFAGVKNYILEKLERELNPDLVYHCLEHTLDVLNSAINIAEKEGVEGNDLILLKSAALFHDSGMLLTYVGHEEASAEIVQEVLPRFEFTAKEIDTISNMIITTKLPQSASNFLEKILCDADLDYLGREDFFMISHRLRYEWIALNINRLSLLEWYQLQVEFLESHQYFTNYAIKLRREKKALNLKEVKELLRLQI
jgi:predicted metal-dependent HD superfamily phosphohydrolase